MSKHGLAIAVASAVSTPAVWAHHSTALVYDRDGALLDVEGVVTEVAWVNPHVRLKLRGAGPDGVERVWDIESNSVSNVSRFGLTAELVAAGTRVKVAGNGGRQLENVLWLTNMLLPNGKEILFGQAVKPRWSQQTIGSDVRGAVTADTNGLGLYRVWTHATNPAVFWGGALPLTAGAAAARAAFNPLTDEPTKNCAPKGMPFIMEQPYPMEIVAAADEILIKMEEYDTVRHVAMKPGVAVRPEAESPLGVSFGRWEGAALVVFTQDIGYRWLNGTGIPLGPDASTEERFDLNADGSRLEYTMKVTDPATFTAPVTFRKAWEWRPGEQVRPYACRG
ncbi:MAG TPA: DUF6152 family protein [Gammaproteobacteria bacterium]|nr:DUF6152 family protein [Gammaproteobacteria bacterium]